MDWLEEFVDIIILLLFFVFAPLLRRLQRSAAEKRAGQQRPTYDTEEFDEDRATDERGGDTRHLPSGASRRPGTGTAEIGEKSAASGETPRLPIYPAEDLRRLLERYVKQAQAEWEANNRAERSSGEIQNRGGSKGLRREPPRPSMAGGQANTRIKPAPYQARFASNRGAYADVSRLESIQPPPYQARFARPSAVIRKDGVKSVPPRIAPASKTTGSQRPVEERRRATDPDPALVRDALILGDIVWGEGATGPRGTLEHRHMPARPGGRPRCPHPCPISRAPRAVDTDP